MRRLLDGLFYVLRTGCQWRHLPPPPAFPLWPTEYGYFRAFLAAGVWESMRHHLVMLLRETEGRQGNRVKPIPSYPEYAEACCIAEARRSLRNRLRRSGNWALLPKPE